MIELHDCLKFHLIIVIFRQQKKLLDLLAELENVDQIEDERLFLKTSLAEVQFSDQNITRKSYQTAENVATPHSSPRTRGDTSIDLTSDESNLRGGTEKCQHCEVHLELMSNWGHADLLGLTEVS